MIKDRNIAWLRQKRVIPWQEFGVITSNTATVQTVGAVTTSAPAISTEISDFALTGIACPETGNTFAAFDFQTPSIIDPSKEIGVRVLYTTNVGSPGATDSVTWLVKYDQVDPGEAIIAPATALDTVIAAQADGGTTGYLYRLSSRGIINAKTLDFDAKTGAMSWLVENDVVANYTASELVFLGLEIDYVPLLCINSNQDLDVYKAVAATN